MKTPLGFHGRRVSSRLLALVVASLVLVDGGASVVTAKTPPAHGALQSTFYNPIMDTNADPWMTKWQNNYYLTATTGDNVTIWESPSITNIAVGRQSVVWSPSGRQGDLADIWSPEIHHVGNRWYIYFAADKNGDNKTHRDYVLVSKANNPMGPYRFGGEVHDKANQWMIDPTLLKLHGKLYFIWSGWTSVNNQVQRLMIAPMSSPTHIDGPGVVISSPIYPWETSVAPINEGPVVLQHNGRTFIVYSANASWTNSYCLGLLTLRGNNPLNPNAWVKDPHPVFQSGNNVFGPGRASFVTSKNGKQYFMIYHAARYNKSGWDRTIRAQPFHWSKRGTPVFGTPVSTAKALALPEGETPNRVKYRPTQAGHEAVFHVSVSRAGTYGVYIRYKNSTSTTVTPAMSINGKPTLPLSLPQTEVVNGKALYSVVSSFITLRKGRSTVQIYDGPYSATIQSLELTVTSVDG